MQAGLGWVSCGLRLELRRESLRQNDPNKYILLLRFIIIGQASKDCAAANDVQALKLRLGEETRADVVRANTLGVASSCDSPVRCCNALFFDPKLYPFLAVAKSTQC